MKTLQEAVEREVAEEIYEKADKIIEIMKNKVRINEGSEKIYPTVKDMPLLRSKGTDMIFYGNDFIIKKCIETFEDGNGHSNIYIHYKDRNEIIPLFYKKKLVFEAEKIHDSPYIRARTLENGYWRFCFDALLKKCKE